MNGAEDKRLAAQQAANEILASENAELSWRVERLMGENRELRAHLSPAPETVDFVRAERAHL